MKRLLAALAVGLVVLAAAPSGRALAKGGGLAITPDAGPAGTEVQLGSDFWQPDETVQIFVASSPTINAEPPSFAGPIAAAVSDASGRWSVRVKVEDAAGFVLPRVPAFVVYKAVSPAAASGQPVGPTEALADFALVVNGHRPNGAGGVRLTIEGPAATAWLDWQPAESDTFYISHVGPFGPPLRDYVTNHLADGDWDIVVPSALVPIAATGGNVITVQATLCASASIPCEPRPGSLTVVRVPVRNGEVVDVTIKLGAPPSPGIAPAAGYGPIVGSSRIRITGIGVAMLAAGAAAMAWGAALRIKRKAEGVSSGRYTQP